MLLFKFQLTKAQQLRYFSNSRASPKIKYLYFEFCYNFNESVVKGIRKDTYPQHSLY